MSKTDILILGATGYTGRLVAEYIANHPQRSSFTFAIGGRSKERMEALASKLSLGNDFQLVQVDAMNREDIKRVVKDYRIVISTVGPFWRYGKYIVEACTENGVHYVDTTGEPWFIRQCIEEYDFGALKTKAIIIHAAGFDSVPSDLSSYLSARTIKRITGGMGTATSSTSAFAFSGSLSPSGGTLMTIIDAVAGNVPAGLIKRSFRSYALSPITGIRPPKRTFIQRLPHTSIIGGRFVMSNANTRLVQRTWGLYQMRAQVTNAPQDIANAYGDKFTYTEFQATRTTIGAVIHNLKLIIAVLGLWITPIRFIALKFLPKAGTGPKEGDLKKGGFTLTNVTSSVLPSGAPGKIAKTVMKGEGEPGYFLTAIMTAEIALALLPANIDKITEMGKEGGVLTPMAAIGDVLVERLEATGKFSFQSDELEAENPENRKNV
ncbi:hypothetical protein FRC03_011682 [Tulasnella sp. 419]|nr:hypothetical protein FRC03_011682 [Tulasnella sp. 419]